MAPADSPPRLLPSVDRKCYKYFTKPNIAHTYALVIVYKKKKRVPCRHVTVLLEDATFFNINLLSNKDIYKFYLARRAMLTEWLQYYMSFTVELVK